MPSEPIVRSLVDRGEPRDGIALVLYGLEKYIARASPDQSLFRLVDDHDDTWIGLKPSLADDLVNAALVVSIFHLDIQRSYFDLACRAVIPGIV